MAKTKQILKLCTQYFTITYKGKEPATINIYIYIYMYIYVSESLCCVHETNKTL